MDLDDAAVAGLAGGTVAGAVFGGLYWRRGLLAAVVAHASANLAMGVLATLIA